MRDRSKQFPWCIYINDICIWGFFSQTKLINDGIGLTRQQRGGDVRCSALKGFTSSARLVYVRSVSTLRRPEGLASGSVELVTGRKELLPCMESSAYIYNVLARSQFRSGARPLGVLGGRDEDRRCSTINTQPNCRWIEHNAGRTTHEDAARPRSMMFLLVCQSLRDVSHRNDIGTGSRHRGRYQEKDGTAISRSRQPTAVKEKYR